MNAEKQPYNESNSPPTLDRLQELLQEVANWKELYLNISERRMECLNQLAACNECLTNTRTELDNANQRIEQLEDMVKTQADDEFTAAKLRADLAAATARAEKAELVEQVGDNRPQIIKDRKASEARIDSMLRELR